MEMDMAQLILRNCIFLIGLRLLHAFAKLSIPMYTQCWYYIYYQPHDSKPFPRP